MANLSVPRTGCVTVVGSVLHEGVHDEVALRAEGFVEDGRDCEVEEWAGGDAGGFGVVVALFQGGEGLAV
jgi:hypothetical protein